MLIRETARRLARYEWVERRLFEILGSWATDTTEPAVARLLAEQSHHHAWHASLWSERRPVLHDVGPDDLEMPASAESLSAAVAAARGVDRLSVLTTDLQPELIRVYEAHLSAADPVADGPVIRVLRLVGADVDADWRAARSLLAAMAPEGAGAERSVARQSMLTELLAPLD